MLYIKVALTVETGQFIKQEGEGRFVVLSCGLWKMHSFLSSDVLFTENYITLFYTRKKYINVNVAQRLSWLFRKCLDSWRKS